MIKGIDKACIAAFYDSATGRRPACSYDMAMCIQFC